MSDIQVRYVITLAINLLLISVVMGDSSNTTSNQLTLVDFQATEKLDNWVIVNDGVMGGLSQSEIIPSEESTAAFQGTVSLENNGGFASARTNLAKYGLGGYSGILLQVRGDGKRYQFRIRTGDRFDGVSYRYHFETEAGEWITIRVPFAECIPVYRGRVLTNVEPISPNQVQQVGFLIADKQAGPFHLEIKWIRAYR